MTVAAPSTRPSCRTFVLEDVSWDFYIRTLEELQDAGRNVRVTYDEGRMEFMSPISPWHEHIKTTIGRLIELYALEHDIPVQGLGSMTCKSKDLEKGIEADECYYVTSSPPPPRARSFDLKRFEPPDLAIEVEISRGSIPKQPIYAALRVPEIWRFDGKKVVPLHRDEHGGYISSDHSLAFPDLAMADFNRFLAMALRTDQHQALRAFRDWLKDHR